MFLKATCICLLSASPLFIFILLLISMYTNYFDTLYPQYESQYIDPYGIMIRYYTQICTEYFTTVQCIDVLPLKKHLIVT